MSNKIETPDGEFNTQSEAAAFYRITSEGIRYRLRYWAGYNVIGKTGYRQRGPKRLVEIIKLTTRKTQEQIENEKLDSVAELGDFSL